MKKFIVFLVGIMCLFATGAVYAAPDGYDTNKIEQVYSRMPEIKAYMKLGEPIGNQPVTGFVDSEELMLTAHAPFNRDEGVSFIFMFDCSTSVTARQMKSMKETVINYIENNSYSNDKFTIVSFGEKIDILADCSDTKQEAVEAINLMKNNQEGTVLYDAVTAAKQISEKTDESCPKKRMCIMFTDAVNYNLGGTTDIEVLTAAETAGTPIYVVAINPNNKDSIDSLGAIARVSGGEVCVAENGDIDAAFKKATAMLSSIYEVSFTANTNKASLNECNLSVCIGEKTSGNIIERKFRSSSWEADKNAPYIVSAEPVSDKELLVNFSEQVENAGKLENYTVKKGENTFSIKDVRYDEKDHSAIITFNEYIGSGNYEITAINIVDCSMEKNPLSENHSFKVSGFAATMANFKNFNSKGGGWLFAILIMIIIVVIAYAVIKKHKGVVVIDNKATFGDNIKYEHKAPKSLPTGYIKLTMEKADGSITNLDINIVQSVIFGRAASCEVAIDDNNLSRQHFAIEFENGLLFVQNLSQTNGTLLNGVPLQTKRKLELGDVISAGQEIFTVSKI